VREVHHRIKNNLQSVAGLLGRELGGHAQLHPRLQVAISQVNAIATVHGLQSARSNETILLCETLEQICKAIGEQTQQTIQWRIDTESMAFLPVQIAEDEAVPIALVLNELVFNAVKHTPPDTPAPTVSLESDGVFARVRIGNSATAGGRFDIVSGQGLNTGLRLVRSLMPAQGATLAYSGIATDWVLTDLLLTTPVVVPTPEEKAI
jgi:two-component sensor histidine kinase